MKAFMDYDTNELVSWWDEMTQMVKAFISDKRYLIVLDDAYRVFCLNEVIEAFQDTMCEGRMIETTCEMSLLSNLKLRIVHHAVRLWGDDESQALFTYAVKVNIPLELPNMKSEIVRRFKGLPLAIVKLENILS